MLTDDELYSRPISDLLRERLKIEKEISEKHLEFKKAAELETKELSQRSELLRSIVEARL